MEFLMGGTAAMGAAIFSNPFEVIKTRLQLQGELQPRGGHVVHYRGVLHAFTVVWSTQGVRALQSGLVASLWFQMCINGVRLGMYQYCEDHGWTADAEGKRSTWREILVGAVGGGSGAGLGSPFYLVKTQMQAASAKETAVGYQHDHASFRSALYNIYSKEGLRGLYRGAQIAMPRAGVGSGVQLTTYSQWKTILQGTDVFADSTLLVSIVSSMISGMVTCVFMTPIDVVSTRLYNQGVDSKGGGILYAGIADCVRKVWAKEGAYGFYKGFWPSLLRVGPHTTLTLVFWDQLKIAHQKFINTCY